MPRPSADLPDAALPRVDQLLPAAHRDDATGDSARHLARALRGAGFTARIYALTVDPDVAHEVLPFDEFRPPTPGDATLLHFALPSTLTDELMRCRGARAIVYHNLTPPELLMAHAPDVARLTALGREELGRLARSGGVDLAIGVSRYNTADLEAAGFEATATLALPVDLHRYATAPDPLIRARYEKGRTLVLTVGRVAPNKRVEDFLRTAAYYLRYIDPDARFVVVGGTRGLEGYLDALMDLHAALELDERVRFVGKVPLEELVAYYRAASAYLCTSAHEGFCVPLLEAMYFEVPILARAAAAVPETLGDAGLTYASPDPAATAEMLHVLATDEALRRRLADRGRQRLNAFRPPKVLDGWVTALRDLTAGRERR